MSSDRIGEDDDRESTARPAERKRQSRMMVARNLCWLAVRAFATCGSWSREVRRLCVPSFAGEPREFGFGFSLRVCFGGAISFSRQGGVTHTEADTLTNGARRRYCKALTVRRAWMGQLGLRCWCAGEESSQSDIACSDQPDIAESARCSGQPRRTGSREKADWLQ